MIYLFGILRRFQHCTGHITMGSWKGRGNQYIQFVRVLYCKLPTNGKQLLAFPLEAMPGTKLRPQRWEARVLQLCHRGPQHTCENLHLLLSVQPIAVHTGKFLYLSLSTSSPLHQFEVIKRTAKFLEQLDAS